MSQRRILVVDDSRVVHELARIALQTIGGWELLSVESGAAAVGVAVAEQPDAVIVDVMMPDMDGPATVRSLRETAETRGLPIIFLTGHHDPDELDRLAALDVAGVLRKPFELTTLAGDIAAMLGWPA